MNNKDRIEQAVSILKYDGKCPQIRLLGPCIEKNAFCTSVLRLRDVALALT